MKKLVLFSFLSLFIFSCNDDDGEVVEPTVDQNDYLPINDNAIWNYAYSRENQDQATDGTAQVIMDGSATIEGNTYKIMDNTLALIGSMDQIYINKADNNEVAIRPIFSLLGYSVDVGDLPFIENAMTTGELIGERTIELETTPMEIPANDYNVTGTVTPIILLTISSHHIDKPSELSVNDHSYTSLIHQKLSNNIEVILDIDADINLNGVTIPFNREHELIDNQEYGELDLWLANEIGIVKTEYDYSFEDLEIDSDISFGGIDIDLSNIAPELTQFNDAIDLEGSAELIDYSF